MKLLAIVLFIGFLSLNKAMETVIICESFPVCANFQVEFSSKNISDVQIESRIASQSHWAGIVPEYYKIDLNFRNKTHYNGYINITFKVIQPTRRIMINQDNLTLKIHYESIIITPLCGMNQTSRRNYVQMTRCIKTATIFEQEAVLVLNLHGLILEANKTYILSIPVFEGRSWKQNENLGGGLQETLKNSKFSATTTIFQMRHARTAFPCFDHPVLKAVFELCIERPTHIMVASNTPPVPSESKSIGNNRKKDCFEPTPVMSTYLFAFALMENYSLKSIEALRQGF